MATFYAGSLGNSTTTRDDQKVLDPGIALTEVKVDTFLFNLTAAGVTNADTVRLGTSRSGIIIQDVEFDCVAFGTSGAIDIGLFYSEPSNGGAVAEVDTFADAYSVSSAVSGSIFAAADGGGGAGISGVLPIVPYMKGNYKLKDLANIATRDDEMLDWVMTINNKGTASSLTGSLRIKYTDAG